MFQTIICASRRKSTEENDVLLDKITIVISIFLPNLIICKHHYSLQMFNLLSFLGEINKYTGHKNENTRNITWVTPTAELPF